MFGLQQMNLSRVADFLALDNLFNRFLLMTVFLFRLVLKGLV